MIVSMLAATLVAAGGFPDLATAAEQGEDVESLKASLVKLRKALADEKTARARDKVAAARTVAVLQGNLDSLKASLTELGKDLKSSLAMQKQLSEEKAALVKTKGAKARTGRMGFDYGGRPTVDSPPVAKGDKEKQALAALDEMTKGKWYLNITTREGRVLRQLVEAKGAKRVVEIGTSSGYSTIWLALGARAVGGKVFTHEINPEKIKMARENFKKAGVDDLITIIKGDAHETVKQHKDPIDVVFLDAEKKGYVDYLAKLLPLVRPGGLILGHDMHGRMPDPRYIKAITGNPDLDTSFIMMESFGISMTVKKR